MAMGKDTLHQSLGTAPIPEPHGRLGRRDLLKALGLVGFFPASTLTPLRASLTIGLAGEERTAPKDIPACRPDRWCQEEMVDHARGFSRAHIRWLDDAQVRHHVGQAIQQAFGVGFSLRGPVRFMLELTFHLGSGFVDDPMFPWVRKALDEAGAEMDRADGLWEAYMAYRRQVPCRAEYRALLRWYMAGKTPPVPSAAGLAVDFRRGMEQAFPEKARAAGVAGLDALVADALDEAREYGLDSSEGRWLLANLKFALGHRCSRDPLFPMIGEVLDAEEPQGARARTARLNQVAMRLAARALRPF